MAHIAFACKASVRLNVTLRPSQRNNEAVPELDYSQPQQETGGV
jgi:hypothetical protein